MAARAVIRDVGRALDIPLRRRRPDREDDPATARNDHARRRRSRTMPDAPAGLAQNDARYARADRRRAAARGARAPRVDARRRRRHRADGRSSSYVPLYRSAERRRSRRSSPWTSSRRSASSRWTSSACGRSPCIEDARRAIVATSTGHAARPRRAAARRPRDLRAVSRRRGPSGVFQLESRRDARAPAAAAARPLRGPRRDQRALPPGPARRRA